jgi:hypothetical protein
MLGKTFRPWGKLSWLLSKSDNIVWNIIGSVSFEDRCTALQTIFATKEIDNHLYFNILPPESIVKAELDEKLKNNLDILEKNGVKSRQIVNVKLLESIDSFLSPLREFLNLSNGNIILDISSLPKRFFFPVLKIINSHDKIKNLIVTYTIPQKYSEKELSWDPADWNHIPTFMPIDFRDSQTELAIISVGFVPLGLPKLLTGKYSDAEVKLLFPHPPGPPNYQRNWEFVRKIVTSYPRLSINEMNRVHALDTSDAFDKLCEITDNGRYKSILAPYGPKPISLAMALFAIDQGVPVYYTQPSYYAPDYSTGIKDTFAYWIINSGNKLFIVKNH